MPRGGSRPGAGRKPLSQEEKDKRAAVRAAMNAKRAAAAAVPLPEPPAPPAAFSPAGVKRTGTPPAWPFGQEPTPPAPPPVVAAPLAEPAAEPDPTLTPLDYLLSVVRDPTAERRDRLQAASLAAPYVHAKIAPQGKKEAKAEAAKAAGGKFSSAAPPLRAVK